MSTTLTIEPGWALPGASVFVRCPHLPLPLEGLPHVRVGEHDARVTAASGHGVRIVVPAEATGGTHVVRIDELVGASGTVVVARVLASGVHQVDSPVFDGLSRLYATHSGGRDAKVSVPLFRIDREGMREPLKVEVPNPTSLALSPDGSIYISSRFDGTVFRLSADDKAEMYATELGVATGLAFAPDGTLFVGDRSGTIFRVSPDRQVEAFATLPASVAAFHLAYGPDQCLYVTAPTFSTRDALYRIAPDRTVDVLYSGFGRPQGLAFGPDHALYVVDALAGSAGLYRLDVRNPGGSPVLVLSAPALIGVAFDPRGGIVLASNDTIFRLDV